MLGEVQHHWIENLTPSSNKRDIVFQHVKGKGFHLYVPRVDGSFTYTCAENSGCRSHQGHSQSSSTKALFKTFLE